MKKQFWVLMTAALLTIPLTGFAMQGMEHGNKAMEHGGKAMDHGTKVMDNPAGAMEHGSKAMEHGEKAMDHGKMMMGGDAEKSMGHEGMAMGGSMIMLQEEEVDGVKASGHLMDVKEKMAEHGMAMTHHIMVGFEDKQGNAVSDGTVAVKVEAPDGKVSEPLKMMGMDGQFGVDLTLDQSGMYHFKIGTKLADGQKRTYHMHYENK